jgi:hypothetical protein
MWLKQRRQLVQAIFVLDRNDNIVYAGYVADQLLEPDYAAALQALQQSAVEWREQSEIPDHTWKDHSVMSPSSFSRIGMQGAVP